MKIKKFNFNKKLVLNKSTVVNLQNPDMEKVYGGEISKVSDCGTLKSLCCPTDPSYVGC
jgi:hypothetical protein